MLRPLLLLLLLANLGYFAWSHRLFAGYGLAPAVQSEPQRLAQQIAPQALRILTSKEVSQLAAQTASAAPVSTAATNTSKLKPAPNTSVECLQAGPFTDTQAANLRTVLPGTLPAGSWQLMEHIEPARWIIYMGKYGNTQLLDKKKSQLQHMGLTFTSVANPELEPGLSLGGFVTQAQATQALTQLNRRGIRTAKVVQERTEVRGQLLKLPAVDARLRSKLVAIKPDLGGKVLQECKS